MRHNHSLTHLIYSRVRSKKPNSKCLRSSFFSWYSFRPTKLISFRDRSSNKKTRVSLFLRKGRWKYETARVAHSNDLLEFKHFGAFGIPRAAPSCLYGNKRNGKKVLFLRSPFKSNCLHIQNMARLFQC